MTRQENSKAQMAKAERLSKALRENLKRRKAQLRGRGTASKRQDIEPPLEPGDKPRKG